METAMNEPHDMRPPSFTLTCRKCGEVVPAEPWMWRHSCGGTLRLDLGVDAARIAACSASSRRGMTRFAPVLPLQSAPETAMGDTPLATEQIDGMQVGLKLEYLNPGGSFKDRGAYVTVARCAELGFKSILVDSSGNAGVAIALMGLRFGIGVDVFLPRSTPEGKKQFLRVLRARLHEIDGDRMAVHAATLSYAASTGAAYAGHWFNPYFAHGVKTMAYEAAEQMPSIDCVFAPVGAGTVLLGLHAGFAELASCDALARMPRLVAVQAAGYSPVCAELGVADPVGRTHLADGIAIAEPPRKAEIAAAVRETGGYGVVVGDPEIATALSWLTCRGYVVEPTSAVPLAALVRCIQDGRVRAGSTVLLPLTGTGMKVLDEMAELVDGNPTP
jgi:threonine synthase